MMKVRIVQRNISWTNRRNQIETFAAYDLECRRWLLWRVVFSSLDLGTVELFIKDRRLTPPIPRALILRAWETA